MSDYVFVGHRFTPDFLADFRRAIKSAFDAQGQGLRVEYADLHLVAGHIVIANIAPLIDGAFFCIFDISDETAPNVFLELGYAFGKGKYAILTSKGFHPPTNLGGFQVLTYSNFAELSDKLAGFLPGIIANVKAHERKSKETPNSQAVLSKEQAWNVIKLDFAALTDIFYRVIEDILRRFEKNPESYRYEDLYRIVKSAIQTSRSMLQGFHCHGVGSIPKFLESNFKDDEELPKILKEEIYPVLISTEMSVSEKREELHRLIKLIVEDVATRLYKPLFAKDSEDEDKDD